MKKRMISIFSVFCLMLCIPAVAYAGQGSSIIIATGQEVPSDSELEEAYRFPEEYRDYAVQFVTEDGVTLCGYVLGDGNMGVAIAHARGWMLKSCLPFAERLVDEGYQVILWEFRNTYPSGNADEKSKELWNLDVLAAVQVLRERGAEQIFCMGASYGGSATAVAATEIPELVGLAILSSPANVSDMDPIGAMKQITVPTFFAVSTNDFQGAPGVYQKEVETLYEACASQQKELHILDGAAHGTDLITVPPEGELGYAAFPETDEAARKRNELAEMLVQFIESAFSSQAVNEPYTDTEQNTPVPETTPLEQTAGESLGNDSAATIRQAELRLLLILGLFAVLIFVVSLMAAKAKRK